MPEKNMVVMKKRFDGRTKASNEAYKNGWNEVYLNRVLKKEVEIGGHGTQRYVIKNGKNKGIIL